MAFLCDTYVRIIFIIKDTSSMVYLDFMINHKFGSERGAGLWALNGKKSVEQAH